MIIRENQEKYRDSGSPIVLAQGQQTFCFQVLWDFFICINDFGWVFLQVKAGLIDMEVL